MVLINLNRATHGEPRVGPVLQPRRRKAHLQEGGQHRLVPSSQPAARTAPLELDSRPPPVHHPPAGGGCRSRRAGSSYARSARPRSPGIAIAAGAPAGADPHGLRRRHARLLGLAGQPGPPPALLGGHDHHRRHQDAILTLPDRIWEPAYDAGDQVRPGAWVAELTGLADLPGWPQGMRVIVRKERPHPGAQLRFTDIGGHRFTCFATDAKTGQLADLELRHRRRARCEDRIRAAKDTGLRNLPLHGFAQNQIWCELVAMACELLAWMQLPPSTDPPAPGNPNGCGCGCSPSPTASSTAGAGCACVSPRPGRGPPRSPPRSPACKHPHPANPHQTAPTTRKDTPGPVEPAHPARQPGSQPPPDTENNNQLQPQPSTSRSRKIEASDP